MKEEKSIKDKVMLVAIWNFVKAHRQDYLIVAIALLVSYALFVVPTQMTQKIINLISQNKLTMQVLLQSVTWLIGSAILTYLADYTWIKRLFGQSLTYRFELRKQLFGKLIHMRTPFYEKFRSGDMLTRFTNDTNDYSELLGFGVMSIFSALGTIFFVLPAMLTISWQITLLAALPILVLGFLVYQIGKKQDIASEEAREAVANLSNEVLEVVEGIRVTRAYGKKALGTQKFQNKTAELVKKSDRIMFYQSAYGRLAYALLAISTAIVIGVGGHYIQEGHLQLGDVIALQLYSLTLMDPMWVLSDVMLIYQVGKVAFSKLNELMDTDDDMEVDGRVTLPQIEKITFKDYSFTYANGEQAVLDKVSVELEKGKTLGIVGKTGSGKTSFVRQLLRQYPLGSGTFEINDKSVLTYHRQSLEEKIGYVPQEHVLFSKSVLENIKFGRTEAEETEVLAAVEAAAFTEDLGRMTQGLATLVGEKGVSISGGQKQRISIARALIKAPDLLILDDSLSAVDARTERMIIENIQRLRQGKTNIIVTHRLSAVNHADWVIVMDEGRIVEAGTPAQLLANQGWYYEQYQRQKSEEGGQV